MAIVKELLQSKKFVAVLISITVWLAGYVGLDVDPIALAPIFATVIAYIVGQGLADHGKEAEKLRQQDPARPPHERR